MEQLARRGIGVLIALIRRLEKQLRALHRQVVRLSRQVARLQAQVALNSRNSSKPPASDGLAKPPPKPKSLRQKSGRRPGGQPGHPGRTLQPVARPDHSVVHRLDACPCGQCGGRSLHQQPVLPVDESGLRVAGRLHWLHVVSSERLTFYGVHRHRGTAAMDEFNILPRCRNVLVQDHWKAYFTYQACRHALSNGHHLRELKFLYEEEQEAWAEELSRFLLEVHARCQREGLLAPAAFRQVQTEYRAILARGRRRHPRRTGRGAQSKAANLLDRLEDYETCVLAVVELPGVPFTNNQGERDIRMEKVRQKVSGCFRTLDGARVFARCRSYLSTCRKQGQNLLAQLENALLGKPFMPQPSTRGP